MKKLLSLLLAFLMVAAMAVPASAEAQTVNPVSGQTIADFADAAKVASWARDGMNTVVAYGIMCGSDGNLNPKSNILRVEVATMLVRFLACHTDAVDLSGFVDGSTATGWMADPVKRAVGSGIFYGRTDGTLDLKTAATREEAFAMLYRVCGLSGRGSTNSTALEAAVEDFDDISDWAKDAVVTLYNAGIISGSSDGGKLYIAPQRPITRQEFAVILARLINLGTDASYYTITVNIENTDGDYVYNCTTSTSLIGDSKFFPEFVALVNEKYEDLRETYHDSAAQDIMDAMIAANNAYQGGDASGKTTWDTLANEQKPNVTGIEDFMIVNGDVSLKYDYVRSLDIRLFNLIGTRTLTCVVGPNTYTVKLEVYPNPFAIS